MNPVWNSHFLIMSFIAKVYINHYGLKIMGVNNMKKKITVIFLVLCFIVSYVSVAGGHLRPRFHVMGV